MQIKLQLNLWQVLYHRRNNSSFGAVCFPFFLAVSCHKVDVIDWLIDDVT